MGAEETGITSQSTSRSYEGRLPGGGTVELRLESQKASWGGVEVLERENIPGAKGEVNSSHRE